MSPQEKAAIDSAIDIGYDMWSWGNPYDGRTKQGRAWNEGARAVFKAMDQALFKAVPR